MTFPEIKYIQDQALELEAFRQMDYYAVENYKLPIELMMENAGLHLAMLVAQSAPENGSILIGIGNGNNGGGGLVAARRLRAWGYNIHLDLFTSITRELPKKQLERAIAFGAKLSNDIEPDVWVDAYLGFSQKLPLRENLMSRIEKANSSKAMRISLDIPTGYLGDSTLPYFNANKVLSLGAPKKILYNFDERTDLFVGDLGIPGEIYKKFGKPPIDFKKGSIIKLIR